jgi:hypothetical protein
MYTIEGKMRFLLQFFRVPVGNVSQPNFLQFRKQPFHRVGVR